MTHFSTETTEDATLRDALQAALPADSASPELRQRVALLAKQAEIKREREFRRAPRLRLAFSAAILAALIAVFSVVWPQVMSNQALAQINAAMARVSSVHMTRFRIEGTKRIKEGETWFQNGQWRVERPEDGYTTLYKSGKRWLYNERAGKVTLKRNAKGPFGHNPTGFTLADLTHDLESHGTKTSVALQGQTTLNGREVKRMLLETKTNYETALITLLVDAETDLPLRGEIIVRTRYGKVGRWQFEMNYNRPLSAKLFEPKFARGVRFVEQGKRDADFQTRLARGLVKKRVGERTIAIRELQVNRNGDVWVLYTAGKRLGKTTGDGFRSGNWFAGRDWKVFLTDSLGTRYHYVRQPLQWSMVQPVAVQGQRLEGDWWVPATAPEPGRSWKPRTFFLNFEVNPKNLHGTFKQTFPDDYSARAQFQIPIDEAENAVVPSLAQSISPGLSEENIVKQESQERGELPPGVQPSPELAREVDEIGTFSPDSTQIATGIVGGVKLVGTQNGQTARVLRVPAPFSKLKVGAPLILADNRILCAAAAFDRTLESDSQWFVWNLQNGQFLGSWRSNHVHDVSLRSVQLAPDGKTLRLVNSIITKRGGDGKSQWVERMDASVEERNVLTGKVQFRRVLPHDGFLLSVEQSASNSSAWQVITSQNGDEKRGLVRAWDARSGALTQTFDNPANFDNNRVVVAKNAPLVAVAGQYFEVKNGV